MTDRDEKTVTVTLTDTERRLLIETLESSTFLGKFAHLVTSALNKLREPSDD